MPLPFDATLKDSVQTYPADYAASFHFDDLLPLAALNVDLSTLSAATDVALGRGDPPDVIIDLNFQSGADADAPARAMVYSSVLHLRYRVPVHSIIILLRPEADHPALTGKLRYRARPRKGKMDFRYEVVRLWRMPVQRILKGGLGTLSLAPLCRMPHNARLTDALPGVLETVIARLNRETTPAAAAKILTGAYVLAGLRMSRDEARQLFGRVRAVQESTTYQAILEEGEVRGVQKTLLRLGGQRFGTASENTRAHITAIEDLARLERMIDHVLHVNSWSELLAVP
jgi:predicted transposase YdaD